VDDAVIAAEGSQASIPVGTVAFLFTDIEASTRRWERFGDAMLDVIRRHDDIFERAVASRRGYVFKKVGDAICAAFWRATDALDAAIAAQRELESADWSAVGGLRVRMAIHCGEAEAREGDYFGPALNRVARLLSIANGGQILLSGPAQQLVRTALHGGIELRDLGEHRLKDLAQPELVALLLAPGITVDPRPLNSLDALPNNLPEVATPLIGREAAVSEIADLLDSQRLVTIAGPGGVGKTRTALQIAANRLGGTRDGVWFVEFAAVSDPRLIAGTIARELGLGEAPHASPLDTLADGIRQKAMLLLLDNCEHVIDETARTVAALLERCRNLRVLATSREPLRVRGEWVYPLPPLGVPAADSATAAEALAYESVALFVARARASDGRFALTDANVASVVDICRRLDGIALAIELAGARVKSMPLKALQARIDERFRVLGGGNRTDLPRRQTLYNLIDWSYNLLTNAEKSIFERLALFADGFTLESAVALCTDGQLDEFAVYDQLGALVDKSLVSTVANEGPSQYRLLESNRAFALAKLRDRQDIDALRARHAALALATATSLDATWAETPSREWEANAAAGVADIRLAIAYALEERHDVARGIELVARMARFYTDYAPIEGRGAVRAASDAATALELATETRARLHLADAMVSSRFQEFERQYEAATLAGDAFAQTGDALGEAMALRSQGLALGALGQRGEASRLLEEASVRFRRLGARRFTAITLWGIADTHRLSGNFELARAVFLEALELAARSGYDRGLPMFEINLAEVEYAVGELAQAIARVEALTAAPSRRDDALHGIAWLNLAAYYGAAGRYAEARTAALKALDLAMEADLAAAAAMSIQHLAFAAAQTGQGRLAARLLGSANAQLMRLRSVRQFTDEREYEALLQLLDRELGALDLSAEIEAGGILEFADAVSLARES
jgi:predicted ATPase/class 3 adenylate cyclase